MWLSKWQVKEVSGSHRCTPIRAATSGAPTQRTTYRHNDQTGSSMTRSIKLDSRCPGRCMAHKEGGPREHLEKQQEKL
ncbi:hypothetical protein RR46_07747 [Papilio xuthus]|uniref:Uncharacterized protein n=1 Tax=Papilio xuthus TaxID=66420 RepID=A0A194QEM4_PAPXU|nr:hypothetical protein RR46_07747 [Papilio xuthus]